ncbi:MAG: hypothetical protein EZS28_017127 [Streblomastix strix]|uniref:Uncharacterized protein n=1 Tax=Streblomastix strix TaxID=222440 RepID=A0A5J4VX99_9EUKA|nr:MAG: hypothetical protein EZS28_017127 [Streblomastix strix]
MIPNFKKYFQFRRIGEKIVVTEISNDESGERAVIDKIIRTRQGKSKLKRRTTQIENEDLNEDSQSEDTQSEQTENHITCKGPRE